MTYKTNAIIFAFAALLVAMPLAANSNAFGDSTVTIPGECGITVPSTISLGTLTKGTVGVESSIVTIITDGNTPGTIDITAGDWLSTGTKSTGHLVLNNVVATNTVTINNVVFTATVATTGAQDTTNFRVGATSDTTTATNLATSINANTAVLVDAKAVGDRVLLSSENTGTTNGYPLISAQTTIVTSGSTMNAGDASGVKYIESTNTRYSFTIDGTNPRVSTYALKNAFDTDAVLFVAISATDSTKDTKMKFQLDGSGSNILVNKPSALVQTLTFGATCNIQN